ncbi:MAG TPA: response regulator [Chloroflexota bacterium]|nr:response regulator [Chloroflexota bacterium]
MAASSSGAPQASDCGGGILVVDDDDAIRLLVCDALTDEGFDVREAGGGQSALDVLESWSPAVIILDLMMPGMDGWHFRERQLALGLAAGARLLVMSASHRIHESSDLKPSAIMPKPFDLSRLIDTVGSLSEAHGS